tara:strand:- start:604 stop:1530 length:927 start_codon:yes stop_codon:yes gene_type:complete
MRRIRILIILSLIPLFYFNKILAFENKILIKVNNEIITSVDILNEIAYLKLINDNLEKLEKDEIIQISKKSIIREKVKIIELSKYFENFEVEEKYYNLLIEKFLIKYKLDNMNEFERFINARNIDLESVKKKIQIELLWNQLIVNKFSQEVRIDKEKIRQQVSQNNLQKEYKISEIFFTLEKNQKLDEKFNAIKKDIQNRNFANAALIHSVSNTSKNSGELGWIKLNALNPVIKKKIINTKIGDHTEPIVIPGGFLILQVNDFKETRVEKDMEKEIEIISKEIVNKQLNQLSNIYYKKIIKEIQINEF